MVVKQLMDCRRSILYGSGIGTGGAGGPPPGVKHQMNIAQQLHTTTTANT